jgi:hypothetical protein
MNWVLMFAGFGVCLLRRAFLVVNNDKPPFTYAEWYKCHAWAIFYNGIAVALLYLVLIEAPVVFVGWMGGTLPEGFVGVLHSDLFAFTWGLFGYLMVDAVIERKFPKLKKEIGSLTDASQTTLPKVDAPTK